LVEGILHILIFCYGFKSIWQLINRQELDANLFDLPTIKRSSIWLQLGSTRLHSQNQGPESWQPSS